MTQIVGLKKITFGSDMCHSRVGYKNHTVVSAISPKLEWLLGNHLNFITFFS